MKTSTLVALGLASSPPLASQSITMKIDGVDYTLDIGAVRDTPAANTPAANTIDVDGWALAYDGGETIYDAIAYRADLTCHLHGATTLEQAKVGLNACLSLLK